MVLSCVIIFAFNWLNWCQTCNIHVAMLAVIFRFQRPQSIVSPFISTQK